MLKGKFVSNCLEENVDDIKFAALYYDQIDILENNVYTVTKPDADGYCYIRGATKCVDARFVKRIKLLEEEGIINFIVSKELRFLPADASVDEEKISEFDKKILDKSYEIMSKVGNQIFTSKDIDNQSVIVSFLSSEVKKVYETYLNLLTINAPLDFEFLNTYYSNLIFEMLMGIYKGENTITSSEVIDTYFRKYYIENSIEQKNTYAISNGNLGVKTIQQLVPNVSSLTFEEILEIRYKCNDELLSYRSLVSQMNEQLISTMEFEKISKDINAYVNTKIGSSLKELEQKILKSKISVGRYFIEGLKDIKSYTPFIASLFLNVPAQISSLLSLGLIGIGAYLKWKENNVDIKNNGLYYLYSIKRQT